MRTLHLGPEFGRFVAAAPGVLDRLGEDVVGRVQGARAAQRTTEVGEKRRPLRLLDREQPACPLEQRRRRAELVSVERAPSSASEELPAPERDRAGLVVDAAEVPPVRVRLLEVVSDDLLLAGRPRALVRLEPRREPRMELCRDAPSARMRRRRPGPARGRTGRRRHPRRANDRA